MEDDFDFEKIYKVLEKKYDLPTIGLLSEDFDIEKITDKETEFTLREIRRTMNEKFSAYLHFCENLINPSGQPMFLFSIIRNISDNDKTKIKEIYNELAKFQIEILKLDTIYSEENEASFIKNSFEKWQILKQDFYKIVEKFEEKFEETENTNKSAYFN